MEYRLGDRGGPWSLQTVWGVPAKSGHRRGAQHHTWVLAGEMGRGVLTVMQGSCGDAGIQ